jgi:hypothetical protein
MMRAATASSSFALLLLLAAVSFSSPIALVAANNNPTDDLVQFADVFDAAPVAVEDSYHFNTIRGRASAAGLRGASKLHPPIMDEFPVAPSEQHES